MSPQPAEACPLISVIIPCYNHGSYLPEALASIRRQDYPALEIIVVDDGSTDDTRAVARRYPEVAYLYQANQGPSAARNAGIARSTGQYLVFLDADDWLLPHALKINAQYLHQNPALAFVSGGHEKVYAATGQRQDDSRPVARDHYQQLLQGNYIGMHAAVMYQRWALAESAFDPAIRSGEDYDLYLRLARNHPVAHHPHPVAAYRLHRANTSANIPWMLTNVLAVLKNQEQYLRTPSERQAYERGQQVWQDYYGALPSQKAGVPAQPTPALPFRSPLLLKTTMLKKFLKRHLPEPGLRLLHQAGVYRAYVPTVGQVNLGDFGRTTPFSTEFGYDRGGPVDRYYIERFLGRESQLVRGRVLEIGDNEYTLGFDKGVTQSDILHVKPGNPRATLIGDLSDAPQLPDNAFDCLILTQTLHLIYDYKAALATCYRILKPGGALLLTVPGLTPIDRGAWKETWYWSFTDAALHRLLAETFPASQVEIGSFGNVFVATAFLYGMGLSEITEEQLAVYDPQFQVINTVRAVKPLARV